MTRLLLHALNRVTNAIEGLGDKSDGTQIKVKKFADISKLAKDEQVKFHGRLNDARDALQDQLKAAGEAGDGQKKLTKTWEEGKR